MTHKEIARRARGRVRRARLQRQRFRSVGFSIITILAMLVFTSTAFDFLQRDRVRVLSGHRSYFYQFPEIRLVVAQAKRGIAAGLPSLLKLDSLFPSLRKKKSITFEEDDDDEELVDIKPLDDLRAAPPKTLFLDAIFDSGGLTSSDDYPPLALGPDFDPWPDGNPPGVGDPPQPAPPIPEPSTGLLVSLGLGMLAAISRKQKLANQRSTDHSAIP